MNKKAQVSVAGVILVVLAMILVIVAIVFIVIKPDFWNSISQPQVTSTGKVVTEQSYQSKNEFYCTPPYIRVADYCCVDQNFNRICDKDETKNNYEEQSSCSVPYMKSGSSCCLDEDRNRVCDRDENYYNSRGNYMNNDYEIDSPFDIRSVSIRSDELKFRLENTENEEVTITRIKVDECDSENYDVKLDKDEDKSFTLDCDFSSSVDSDIEVTYIKAGSNSTLTASGRIESERRRTISYYDEDY